MFADIIFPSIKDKSYTYKIDDDTPRIGARVIVPLGNRKETGFVIAVKEKSEHKNLKSIIEIIDEDEVLTPDLWELSKWMSNYYYSDWGDTLRAFFPKETKIHYNKTITLTINSLDKALSLINVKTEGKLKILQEIFLKQKIDYNTLKKKTGVKNINNVLTEFSGLGIAAVELTSQGAKKKYEKTINLTPEYSNRKKLEEIIGELSEKQAEQLMRIASISAYGKKPLKFLEALKAKQLTSTVITTLIKKGILVFGQEEVIRSEAANFPVSNKKIIPNSHQQIAIDEIISGIESNEYNPYYLYGITGSGKTQVYIEAIKHALGQGKTAIVLVPEISLTPQLVQRFRNHFDNIVTVIHSKMSAGERYDSWRLIIEGKYKIVIGARSAVFAPLKNLGIIIVDEEHEPSYKQFDLTPRYNGRDTAIMRAIFAKAAVVLGSATPSIESFYNAKTGKFKLLELPERADNAQLPEIEIISLKRGNSKGAESISISEELKNKITEKLNLNQKIILLQNHRGFSTVARCFNCGYVEVCENCNVTLTYHRTKHHLRCHYCGFVKPINDICPQCNSQEKEFSGVGTQKVEDEIHQLFPSAKLIRMDLDTTSKKGAHSKLLRDFGEGKADILLGTQMVAKGLDFADVTLVGVILADTSMHFPDFRANERTFQLLTQVAGRAGRSNLKGEVILQTFQPNHKCFEFVKTQNFNDYYDYEISERKSLMYPPFGRLILIEFKGSDENEVANSSQKFADLLASRYSYKLKSVRREFCKIMGPNPAVISKVNNQYRYQIIIKMFHEADPSFKISRSVIDSAKEAFDKNHLSNKVKYSIDVDPQGLM